ncbi:hypothetical protein H5410_027644 [Solanum commersonii]|uniref:Uncharacterized protein n=1 Tax=Solanum commersonii TaxID=4109 RepID=A0A9J5Z2H3_SOLCO|nr:hypothetical protein H5410_027644 [Solanum commersonii]
MIDSNSKLKTSTLSLLRRMSNKLLATLAIMNFRITSPPHLCMPSVKIISEGLYGIKCYITLQKLINLGVLWETTMLLLLLKKSWEGFHTT